MLIWPITAIKSVPAKYPHHLKLMEILLRHFLLRNLLPRLLHILDRANVAVAPARDNILGQKHGRPLRRTERTHRQLRSRCILLLCHCSSSGSRLLNRRLLSCEWNRQFCRNAGFSALVDHGMVKAAFRLHCRFALVESAFREGLLEVGGAL